MIIFHCHLIVQETLVIIYGKTCNRIPVTNISNVYVLSITHAFGTLAMTETKTGGITAAYYQGDL